MNLDPRLATGCLLALAACAPAHAATDLAIEWASFATPQSTFDHAVLLLPVDIDGVRCTAQLDTGANYAFMDRAWHAQAAPRTALLRVGAVARTVPLSDGAFDRVARGDCANIGRIGNALFEHGSITLDLAHGRFAYTPGSLLAGAARAARLDYVTPAGWDGGLLLVDYRFDRGVHGTALLDTGAALFALTLDDADAARAAARGPLMPLTAASAGAAVACVIGTLDGGFEAGPYHVAGGEVGSCRKPLPDVGRIVSGVVGLGGFAGKRIVIDYPGRKWQVD